MGNDEGGAVRELAQPNMMEYIYSALHKEKQRDELIPISCDPLPTDNSRNTYILRVYVFSCIPLLLV